MEQNIPKYVCNIMKNYICQDHFLGLRRPGCFQNSLLVEFFFTQSDKDIEQRTNIKCQRQLH